MEDFYEIQALESYGSWLYYIKRVLASESDHLRGVIDGTQLVENQRRALAATLGFRKRDLDKVVSGLGENYFDTYDWEKDFTFE